MVAQLDAWFGDLGLPILPLSGYASQSFVDEVRRNSDRPGRPAVLLYAGDLDASGEDIDRDFIARTHCFDEIERIALTWEQVEEHALPPQPGKSTDTRALAFTAKYGQNIQVELDALPPDVLRALFQAAIDARWDVAAYDAALEKEERARRTIQDWRA
jgi:hypothetical protein